MAVVEEAVKHGADRSRIAQQLAKVFHRMIRGQHGAGPLAAKIHCHFVHHGFTTLSRLATIRDGLGNSFGVLYQPRPSDFSSSALLTIVVPPNQSSSISPKERDRMTDLVAVLEIRSIVETEAETQAHLVRCLDCT